MPINESKPHKFQVKHHHDALREHLETMDKARQQSIQLYNDAINYVNQCNAHLKEALTKRNKLIQEHTENNGSVFSLFSKLFTESHKDQLDKLDRVIKHWENEISQMQHFLTKDDNPAKFIAESEATYKEMSQTYEELSAIAKQHM